MLDRISSQWRPLRGEPGGVLMEGIWQIQEAKSNLSEVIERAIDDGPQILIRGGEEIAVVLSYPEYLQLKKERTPLSEFFRQSPLESLDLARDRSPAR
jgi:prevent-host-death family protein